MRSLFEVKTNLTYDANIFEHMKKTAQDILQNAERAQYTQAVVLLSSNDNEYSAIIKNALSEEKADEAALLEALSAAEDTDVRCVLCMWGDLCIDIPSFAFRNMLRELNPKNDEALLFVMTKDEACVMKLSSTMK